MPLLSRLVASLKGSGWDEEEVKESLSSSESECSADVEGSSEVLPDVSFADGFLRSAVGRGWRPTFPMCAISEPVYDFLEVFAGCSRMSTAWAKEGFSVLLPLELKGGWELRDQKLFLGVLSLVTRGKVRFVWWAPPSSLARSPKLRNLLTTRGFRILDLNTLLGNLYAVQCFLLAFGQISVGHAFCAEQPAFGFMRAFSAWRQLVQMGALDVLFDWCRFLCQYRKTTRLVTNVPAFRQLGKRCCHKTKHKRLEGQATTKARAYSSVFCQAVARCWKSVWLPRQDMSLCIFAATRPPKGPTLEPQDADKQ